VITQRCVWCYVKWLYRLRKLLLIRYQPLPFVKYNLVFISLFQGLGYIGWETRYHPILREPELTSTFDDNSLRNIVLLSSSFIILKNFVDISINVPYLYYAISVYIRRISYISCKYQHVKIYALSLKTERSVNFNFRWIVYTIEKSSQYA